MLLPLLTGPQLTLRHESDGIGNCTYDSPTAKQYLCAAAESGTLESRPVAGLPAGEPDAERTASRPMGKTQDGLIGRHEFYTTKRGDGNAAKE